MPETDVTKMKVADLKRELKLRGLATTGNKNELQDRLQTALLDGEISLEDTAISAEDALLDEDAVLTDEEEAKILGDENELLQSPTTTPTVGDLTSALNAKSDSGDQGDDEMESSGNQSGVKKIVLKRKSSFSASNAATESTSSGAVNTTKENTEPTKAKHLKMSERNPITVGTSGGSATSAEQKPVVAKVAQLSLQERLELRAKKFGISSNAAPTTTAAGAVGTTTASGGEVDQKQIEMLKKRAERFGCVVSSKIAKIDAEEKLLKRKQRFGGAETTSNNSGAATGTGTDVWAEKARARLERFKTTPAAGTTAAGDSTTSAAVKATVASN